DGPATGRAIIAPAVRAGSAVGAGSHHPPLPGSRPRAALCHGGGVGPRPGGLPGMAALAAGTASRRAAAQRRGPPSPAAEHGPAASAPLDRGGRRSHLQQPGVRLPSRGRPLATGLWLAGTGIHGGYAPGDRRRSLCPDRSPLARVATLAA